MNNIIFEAGIFSEGAYIELLRTAVNGNKPEAVKALLNAITTYHEHTCWCDVDLGNTKFTLAGPSILTTMRDTDVDLGEDVYQLLFDKVPGCKRKASTFHILTSGISGMIKQVTDITEEDLKSAMLTMLSQDMIPELIAFVKAYKPTADMCLACFKEARSKKACEALASVIIPDETFVINTIVDGCSYYEASNGLGFLDWVFTSDIYNTDKIARCLRETTAVRNKLARRASKAEFYISKLINYIQWREV